MKARPQSSQNVQDGAAAARILLVEDEPDIAELVSLNLENAGYAVEVVQRGRLALQSVERRKPDLIILDLMLPDLSGTEVAVRIRSGGGPAIPIIMLTARAAETDQIVGLKLGADDYITKPFSMPVLLARVEALLRRAARRDEPDAAALLRLGPLEIDDRTHQARLDGRVLRLTLTEYRLLRGLVEAGGRVLSRRDLMARAMGEGVTVTERTIDVHVASIRRKLEQHGSLVETVRGVGFRASVGDGGESGA